MNHTSPIHLSKTRIMLALQCPKRLHFKFHRPEDEVVDSKTHTAFATGNAIGELARDIYASPGSVFVDCPHDELAQAIDATEQLIRNGHREPIFEATFRHDNVLVRVDALIPDGNGWRIVEVKASTQVKDEHIPDCTIQAWVCRGAGLDIAGVSLAHVDNSFVYAGDGDYSGLLVDEDVTDAVMTRLYEVPEWIHKARSAASDNTPEIEIGRHCDKPYECTFKSLCWPTGTRFPITGLGGSKTSHYELVREGFRDITEIPADRISAAGQRRVHTVTLSGKPEILEGASAFMRALPYPRFYLDFETAGPAIPIWAGMRPYRQLPFQYSIHIERQSGRLEHREFLDLSGEPPMRALAEELIAALGQTGPVLMYTSFEAGVIKALAELFPHLAESLYRIVERLVDIKPAIKEHYYHPDMLGSWSIKAVLPTIATELSYESLSEIKEGTAASLAYLEAISPTTSEVRREDLKRKMLEYCRMDTEAMVRLVRFFETSSVPPGESRANTRYAGSSPQ